MDKVIILSGLSGAGKTVALRALEDGGYFCIDNLPLTLIEPLLSTLRGRENIIRIGISVDIREKEFLSDANQILSDLKRQYNLEILFLEAEEGVIIRRYKETRRPHPMRSFYREDDLPRAISEEKTLLSPVRDVSDRIIDTSAFTPHQLRQMIISVYSTMEETQPLNFSLISFGYKYGVPPNLDLLFDVRFLPNPNFIPELKPFKGTDNVVYEFVLKNDDTKKLLTHITGLFDFLIPQYIKEARSYLTIGIGCTGGRHRSPAIAVELSRYIKERHNLRPKVVHRDME